MVFDDKGEESKNVLLLISDKKCSKNYLLIKYSTSHILDNSKYKYVIFSI